MVMVVMVVIIRAPIAHVARAHAGSIKHNAMGAAAGAVREVWVNGMRGAV